MLAALEKQGLRENTLVVVTSDNGGSTAENNDLKYPDDNCPNGRLIGNNQPLRGQKGNVYEGGTRVPTIVSWPGRIAAGQVESPTQIVDWMPTFCALAGAELSSDPHWDGTDLSALLLQHQALPERSLYTVGPGWRAVSLRRGDWKLVVSGSGEKQQNALYQIADDPAEQHDVSGQNPEQLQKMLGYLARAAAADRDAVVQQ